MRTILVDVMLLQKECIFNNLNNAQLSPFLEWSEDIDKELERVLKKMMNTCSWIFIADYTKFCFSSLYISLCSTFSIK